MFTFKSCSLTLLSCFLSWLYLSSPSIAQLNSPDSPNFQHNEYNSLTGTDGLNPLDLIHRANFGTSRTPEQFNSDTQQNLNEAASDFKRQQQQLWENQRQADSE